MTAIRAASMAAKKQSDGLCAATFREHRYFVRGVSWSADGEILATSSGDSVILFRRAPSRP